MLNKGELYDSKTIDLTISTMKIHSIPVTDWLTIARPQLRVLYAPHMQSMSSREAAAALGYAVCEVFRTVGNINNLAELQLLDSLPYGEFVARITRAQSLSDTVLFEMISAVGPAEELLDGAVHKVVGKCFNAASVPARIPLMELCTSISHKRYLARHCSSVGRLWHQSGAHAYHLHINKAYAMALEWSLRESTHLSKTKIH
jgi:hypothetical protein